MNGLIPPGARVVLIGSAATLKGLDTFTPLEEGTAEGSLMLMRLDFADFPTADALGKLEKALEDAGVPAWPGYGYIVYADASTPSAVPCLAEGHRLGSHYRRHPGCHDTAGTPGRFDVVDPAPVVERPAQQHRQPGHDGCGHVPYVPGYEAPDSYRRAQAGEETRG